MIVAVLNRWGAWRYKHRWGVTCTHPPALERQQLIDCGMRKMFWCGNCDWTTFT